MAKKALSPEERSERRLMILTPVVAVLLALIIGAIIIACLGKNPRGLCGHDPGFPG